MRTDKTDEDRALKARINELLTEAGAFKHGLLDAAFERGGMVWASIAGQRKETFQEAHNSLEDIAQMLFRQLIAEK